MIWLCISVLFGLLFDLGYRPGFTRKQKRGIAGFSARACENCGDVFIEVQYEVEESGNDPIIVTKNEHIYLCPLKTMRANEMARQITKLAANLTQLQEMY